MAALRPMFKWPVQGVRCALVQRHTRACVSTAQSKSENPTMRLLEATLPFVPSYGWTMESMMRGAKALGYPSVAHGLFVHGESGLVDAFLKQCRQHHVQQIQQVYDTEAWSSLSKEDKIKQLMTMRLELMKPYIERWPEALAIMAYPTNVPMSLTHLAELVDDVWYYAGDRSPDFDWYTKRACLSAVYTSTELFMTQDRSPEYNETFQFLDRRLKQMHWLGAGKQELGIMLNFGAKSFIGLLNTRGIRV